MVGRLQLSQVVVSKTKSTDIFSELLALVIHSAFKFCRVEPFRIHAVCREIAISAY